ncbi:MAG: HAMP domain-containing histidine kinase [Deltaproteobacteria bacterium]|nr:HAMP domain-containing histidine kinase [Deltaproteobacteria bacterium]MDQ3295987.1 HAMP domain-containing histidine kinase [Myxococcota bacterium]
MGTRTPTPPAVPIATAAPAEDRGTAVPEAIVESPPRARGTRDDVSGMVPLERPGDMHEKIALIAHDLKTPLNIIVLEAQMFERHVASSELPGFKRGLERIEQNAAYIDRLLADLLDLASLEAGQLQLRLERIDLETLLGDALERAVSTVDRGRVHLELRNPAIVDADRGRLERVVANFISNAFKFSHSTTPVMIALEVDDGHACVSVTDHGRGLSPDEARTVFERYRRVGDANRDGHGLGLYISRRIIDAHGGRIGVRSTLGKGSRFYFELAVANR